jgi:hypothetical protein
MATKENTLQQYINNGDIRNNATYNNFLSSPEGLAFMAETMKAAGWNNFTPGSVSTTDGATQRSNDYLRTVLNDPEMMQQFAEKFHTQQQRSGKAKGSSPKPTANTSATQQSFADFAVERMRQQWPDLKNQSKEEVLRFAAYSGMTPILEQAYANKQQQSQTAATTELQSQKLDPAFAAYAVNEFRNAFPAIAQGLTDQQLLTAMESRMDGHVMSNMKARYNLDHPNKPTEKQNSTQQQTVNPSTGVVVENGNGRLPTQTELQQTTVSAKAFAQRTNNNLMASQLSVYEQSVIEAEKIRIALSTSGGTLSKSAYMAMTSNPAIASQVFDQISGDKEVIVQPMVQREQMAEQLKTAIRSGEIKAPKQEQRQQQTQFRA